MPDQAKTRRATTPTDIHTDLMKQAENRFPGITELVKVYGYYDRTVTEVRAVSGILTPPAVMSTTNQTS